MCFYVSLDHFGFVLSKLAGFVGFSFFSVPSQETGRVERLRDDLGLLCVEWDVCQLLDRHRTVERTEISSAFVTPIAQRALLLDLDRRR